MIHHRRRFSVKTVETPEELAKELTERTWTLCTGFRLGDLLILNDSISEDGAAEFAIFRDGRQIESVTFGWCSEEQALGYLRDFLAGGGVKISGEMPKKIETPEKHGTCCLCE